MRKFFAGITCALAVLILAPTFMPAVSASANSAQTWWRGQDMYGSFVMSGDCPIVVEHEKLTLNVPHFPSNDYHKTVEELDAYAATVTAEYTFYNPSDLDVTARLAFPFGKRADYMQYYDETVRLNMNYDDSHRYSIKMDGEETGYRVRHTYSSGKFDLEEQLSKLDSKLNRAATPVVKYVYLVETDEEVRAKVAFGNLKGELRVVTAGNFNYDGTSSIEFDTKMGTYEFYVIGGTPASLPKWTFTKKSATATLKSKTEMTFSEIPYHSYNSYLEYEAGDVSESDWMNVAYEAVFARTGIRDISALNVSKELMRWYEYELEIPAGGRVINSVTAPLYPDIDTSWDTPVYSYTYLLSPATTWAEFGGFELEIQTPYFVTESSLKFAKGEGGYSYSQEGLPKGELTFSLSTVAKPTRHNATRRSIFYFFAFFWWAVLIGLVVLVIIIIVIIRAVRRRKAIREYRKKF